MTDFQQKIINVLKKDWNNSSSIGNLVYKLNSNNLAVHSSCLSLEKQGIIFIHNIVDRYSNYWYSLKHYYE